MNKETQEKSIKTVNKLIKHKEDSVKTSEKAVQTYIEEVEVLQNLMLGLHGIKNMSLLSEVKDVIAVSIFNILKNIKVLEEVKIDREKEIQQLLKDLYLLRIFVKELKDVYITE